MFTTVSRAQRSTTVGAVLALFLGLLMFASPAQAATTVDLTASETAIVLGESVTLNWTSTEAALLTASGDWSGAKEGPNGSESVTPTTVGTKTFTLATDGPTDTVTVEVTAAEPDVTEVTPGDVTFPGECTVVVPGTTGVKYTWTIDGQTDDIDAGTYDGDDFLGDEDTGTFRAEALNSDFVIARGATVTWTYDAFEDCFGEGDALVSAETSCSAVTFTNVTDEPVEVIYGDIDEEKADGDVTIPAGGTRKISTSRDELDFVALSGDLEEPTGIQIDFIDVPQDCGVDDPDDSDPDVEWPIKHPTRAPAAGVVADGVVGQGGGPSLPAMALLSALGLIAVRRGYTLGR